MQGADLLAKYKKLPMLHWMLLFEIMPNWNKDCGSFLFDVDSKIDMMTVETFNKVSKRVWTVGGNDKGELIVTEGKDRRMFDREVIGYIIGRYAWDENLHYTINEKLKDFNECLNYFNGRKSVKKIRNVRS